jgi:hypothetical protein
MKCGGENDGGKSVEVPYITGRLPIQTIDINLLKDYVRSYADYLGENYAYVHTYDNAENLHKYYKFNTTEDDYVEITEDDINQFKLEIYLDQIVADEYIFGVTGEGE